ncbi:MAG: hypothetical protein GC178_02795 [Flavobacteriales bacterium]|nr:hypothetical protein [Flavobacteriales bacterium]
MFRPSNCATRWMSFLVGKPMTKLYLDIDGVILTTKNPRPAPFAVSFLEHAVSNFDCYWLTTHCKGNSQTALNYLANYFDPDSMELVKKVKATDWSTLKTEAIDLGSDFFWLDDHPLQAELKAMKEIDRLDRVIIVNLNREGELQQVLTQILQESNNYR